MVALAEALEPQLYGPGQAAALRQLDPQLENLRTAVRWALGRGEAEVGLHIVR